MYWNVYGGVYVYLSASVTQGQLRLSGCLRTQKLKSLICETVCVTVVVVFLLCVCNSESQHVIESSPKEDKKEPVFTLASHLGNSQLAAESRQARLSEFQHIIPSLNYEQNKHFLPCYHNKQLICQGQPRAQCDP